MAASAGTLLWSTPTVGQWTAGTRFPSTLLTRRSVDLVVAYMGALKAGATVSVLDPQYPPDRQTIYLEVASPRFLVQIERATEEAGKLPDKVREFITQNLSIKAEVPALKLRDDGTLAGGEIDGKDCLEAQESVKGQLPGVLVGPDSIPTRSVPSSYPCPRSIAPVAARCAPDERRRARGEGEVYAVGPAPPRSRPPVDSQRRGATTGHRWSLSIARYIVARSWNDLA